MYFWPINGTIKADCRPYASINYRETGCWEPHFFQRLVQSSLHAAKNTIRPVNLQQV